MRTIRSVAVVVIVLAVQGAPDRVAARSLADRLDEVLEFEGELEQSPEFRDQLLAVVMGIQRSAARSADFIATATAPGFTYHFNPETGAFERGRSSRGPVYVEPPQTVGKGGIDLGMSYLYADFTELDGESLEDALDELEDVRGTDVLDIETDNFDIRSHVFSFSGTYGLTDRWDVNLLLPLFVTTLELSGESALLVPGAPPFRNPFDEDDTKVGPGDLLLRTKYRLADRAGVELASAFTLRLPTGDEDNFQGLGDVILTPLVAAMRTFGPHDVHANFGIEVDASDVDRSRARYAIGVSLQLLEPLAFLVDVVGSSGFTDDDFEEGSVQGSVPRSDIVDLFAGTKVRVSEHLVAHLGAFVPITNDGLRADVVPAGGIEASF